MLFQSHPQMSDYWLVSCYNSYRYSSEYVLSTKKQAKNSILLTILLAKLDNIYLFAFVYVIFLLIIVTD